MGVGGKDLIVPFEAYIAFAPFGFVLQAKLLSDKLSGEDPPAVVFVAGSEQVSHDDAVVLSRLTDHGWKLFDAAIDWLTG